MCRAQSSSASSSGSWGIPVIRGEWGLKTSPALRADSASETRELQSVEPSPTPTPTPADDTALRAACAEAVEELKAARKLLASQGTQIEKQNELIALERQITTGVKNLRTLDAEEKQHLRDAIAAANRQVTALEAANAVLKKRQFTFWKKAKVFVIGAAAGIVVGAIALNR